MKTSSTKYFVPNESTISRYLPGIKLPSNIRAMPDLLDACKDATLLVFVVPHQVCFIRIEFVNLMLLYLSLFKVYVKSSKGT